MRATRLVIGMTLLAMAGCVRADIAEHVVIPNYAGNLQRIFIVDATNGGVVKSSDETVGRAIMTALQGCKLMTGVFTMDGISLDTGDHIKAAVKAFRPDAVLIVQQPVEIGALGGSDGTYLLMLKDATLNRDIWKATVQFQIGGRFFSSLSEGYTKFGTRIVQQMATDGVLRSCPAAPAVPG